MGHLHVISVTMYFLRNPDSPLSHQSTVFCLLCILEIAERTEEKVDSHFPLFCFLFLCQSNNDTYLTYITFSFIYFSPVKNYTFSGTQDATDRLPR